MGNAHQGIPTGLTEVSLELGSLYGQRHPGVKSFGTFATEADFAELETQLPEVFVEARKRLRQSRKRLTTMLDQHDGLLDIDW